MLHSRRKQIELDFYTSFPEPVPNLSAGVSSV